MNERYRGKVVSITNEFYIVVNVGAEHGIKAGMRFLVVGLGDTICDPDTGGVLERLEIVRGRAEVTHVQEKISTLKSTEVQHQPDTREIRKVRSQAKGIAALIGTSDVVTESYIPSEPIELGFEGVQVGDMIIELSLFPKSSLI